MSGFSLFAPLELLKERTGPYWRPYQRRRRRDEILDNPDYVPEWFLRDTAVNRLREAAVSIEQAQIPVDTTIQHLQESREAHQALLLLAGYVKTANGPQDPLGMRERVLGALLGVLEEEEFAERLQAGLDIREGDDRA